MKLTVDHMADDWERHTGQVVTLKGILVSLGAECWLAPVSGPYSPGPRCVLLDQDGLFEDLLDVAPRIVGTSYQYAHTAAVTGQLEVANGKPWPFRLTVLERVRLEEDRDRYGILYRYR